MANPFKNQKLAALLNSARPWVIAIAIVLVLKYTGALSGISYVTQSALFETGIMNIDPGEPKDRTAFDYNFSVKDLEGNTIDFDQFKGKVVFLNLWATWCGPCRVEMPSIEELYGGVDKEKVVFVMLSLDKQENHGKVVKYVKDKGFTFPVYTPSGYLPEQLQVPSIPTTFIIDKQGNIKTKKVGTANYNTDKFKRFLEELANQ